MPEQSSVIQYLVWDRTVRWFHWINVLCVFALLATGALMLYKSELNITGTAAKISLKELHAVIGYVFSVNLLWRLIWAWFGSKNASWSSIVFLPVDLKKIRNYIRATISGDAPNYAGHNPLGKLAVTVLFCLMIIMCVTGLVRAGTDIYYPPFGDLIKNYIAQPGVNPDSLIPYDKTDVNPQRKAQLDSFKKPFGVVHYYTAFALLFMIILHITFVVIAENREEGNIITAMFNGKKSFSKPPVDIE